MSDQPRRRRDESEEMRQQHRADARAARTARTRRRVRGRGLPRCSARRARAWRARRRCEMPSGHCLVPGGREGCPGRVDGDEPGPRDERGRRLRAGTGGDHDRGAVSRERAERVQLDGAQRADDRHDQRGARGGPAATRAGRPGGPRLRAESSRAGPSRPTRRVAVGAPSDWPLLAITSTRRRILVRRSTTDAVASIAASNDLRVMGAGPGVEHDDRAGAPLGLVLADHEVAGPGRRAPVHAPKVVADLVLAQREELLAVGGLSARVRRLDRRDELAARLTRREDVVHARAHRGPRSSGAERPSAPGEPERIGDADTASGPIR